MKIKTPSRLLTVWFMDRFIILNMILLLILSALPARSKPVPKNDGAGCAVGIAMLVCGGVIIYCMVRTCKKVFNTNSPPPRAWTSNQSPTCVEIILPCAGEGTNQSFIRSGVLTIHELQRTTNFVDWDIIDTQYGDVDELNFQDYNPPQSGATYRLVSW